MVDPKQGDAPASDVLTSRFVLPDMQLDLGATSDSTWLDHEARAEIYQMLDEYRSDRQGLRYPAFISTRRANGGGYRHHFRALPRNRSLEADAEGRTMLYVYGRRDPSSSGLTLLVAAIIPASAEAVQQMNTWVQASRRGPVSLAPQPDTGLGAGLMAQSSTECMYSEQLVFYADECGCWGYELLEVCADGGGGGGDWPPPDDGGGPWDPGDPWDPNNPGGGGDPGSGDGGSGDGCDPTMIDQPPHCLEPDPDPCEGATPPAWCSNQCDTEDLFVNRIEFQEEAERLFSLSYGPPGETLPQHQRKERGSWVYQRPDGSLDFLPVDDTNAVSCRIPFPKTPPQPNPIAIVHTHPFTHGEQVTDPGCLTARNLPLDAVVFYNSVKASEGDSGAASYYDIPVYALDVESIIRVDTDGTLSSSIARCGY